MESVSTTSTNNNNIEILVTTMYGLNQTLLEN